MNAIPIKKIKKVAVFLPAPYKGGSLAGAKNIAKMLQIGSRNLGEDIDVVFSCVTDTYNLETDFIDLINLNIEVRETCWKKMKRQEVKIAQTFIFDDCFPLLYDEYVIPNDGISNFNDCDVWLLISDRTKIPIAPLKPYGVVVYDYIQRRYPAIFGDGETRDEIWSENFEQGYLGNVRGANFVFTTTPFTYNDAISYAGISEKKVWLVPMEFDFLSADIPSEITSYKPPYDYIIWPTNSSLHKNHINALNALEIYYENFNGKLKTLVTGAHTEWFAQKKQVDFLYVKKVSEQFKRSPVLTENVSFLGNLNTKKFVETLAGAKFLWHPTLVDNGTYAVIEAAYYDVPSLSHDYPPMQYINQRFNLNLTFCDANNPMATAIKLKEMEDNFEALRQQLPLRDQLNQHTYLHLANDFWKVFNQALYEN